LVTLEIIIWEEVSEFKSGLRWPLAGPGYVAPGRVREGDAKLVKVWKNSNYKDCHHI